MVHGVVTARVRSSVRSLRDLHQSTYLYLSNDRDPTSHQVVSDFRVPMRYYPVPLVQFTIFHTEIYQKDQKFTLSAVNLLRLRKFNL
jgi:hypothetical protein